ncbi:MAG: hypothetical protein RLZZ127_2089 [Planctomycetota bacterium]|jgi:hypothetical protein
MPLTPLQRRVVATLRRNRHPGSHVAWSLPLHTAPDSQRVSRDLDLFHDAQAALAAATTADIDALITDGLHVARTDRWSDTFRRAVVSTADDPERLEIDWAVDSAWRFFPPVQDPVLGWRLHDVDNACNKALALASRSETRDLIDIVAWHHRLDLAVILWAACGKDPGFTPLSLLDHMRRQARIDPAQLAVLKAASIDPVRLKTTWLDLADDAERRISRHAGGPDGAVIGVLYLGDAGRPVWPDPARPATAQGLTPHHPSVGGCIPRLVGIEPPPPSTR